MGKQNIKRKDPVVLETYVKQLTPPPENTRPSKKIIKSKTMSQDKVAVPQCS